MIILSKGTTDDYLEVFRLTKEHILKYEIRVNLLDKIIPQVEERIKNHIEDIYRIYHDEQHVGYITLIKMDNDVVQIDDFYIFEKFQRKGYGSEVINTLTKRYSHLQLYVFRNNPIAIKLYKKFNFEIIDQDVIMYKMKYASHLH